MARWKEEIILCQTDLECSERWFKHQAEQWETRVKGAKALGNIGHACYAAKQAFNWHKLQASALGALDQVKQCAKS